MLLLSQPDGLNKKFVFIYMQLGSLLSPMTKVKMADVSLTSQFAKLIEISKC